MSLGQRQGIAVQVLTFAQAKDWLGAEKLLITVPPGSTVQEALRQVALEDESLQAFFRSCRVAVNQEYASWDAVLRAGDEVAILPPVSGG